MPTNLVTSHFKSNANDVPFAPQWSRQSIVHTFYNGTTAKANVSATQCTLEFHIGHDLKPPVLFYYKLTNFYQNHRRYAKSFSTDQLSGSALSAKTLDGGDCAPLTSVDGKPYYPCGLVANSMFNDTFSNLELLNTVAGSSNGTYAMNNKTGIAWSSDKDLYGTTKYKWSDVAVPPNWKQRYPNDYSDDYHPDIENDEALQVWMRLAGLPTFSKLAQRNDDETMVAGNYRLNITHCRFSYSPGRPTRH